MKEVSTKKLVETIVEGIQNRKGQRIVTVDLRKLPIAPAEYFVIAEGGSNTQVSAIADEVDSFVRTKTHIHPLLYFEVVLKSHRQSRSLFLCEVYYRILYYQKK